MEPPSPRSQETETHRRGRRPCHPAFVKPNPLARTLPEPICGPNRLTITVKQLIDASNEPPHMGRLLLSGTPVYTVEVCGILLKVDQCENLTTYSVYDGTGYLNCVAWSSGRDGRSEMSGAWYENTTSRWFNKTNPGCPGTYISLTSDSLGAYYIITGTVSACGSAVGLSTLKARKVTNYNEITAHFLSAIHESLSLLHRLRKVATKPETIVSAGIQLCKSAIKTLLRTDNSQNGLTSGEICNAVGNSPETIRKAIQQMIDEGEVYNTVDYSHYKLAD